MTARIEERSQPCLMCRIGVTVKSSTTDDPEAPELVQLPPGAWLGFVAGSRGGPELVLVCSDKCRLALLHN